VVNLVEKSESSFSRRAWFGALLPLAQNLEQMALDVGSLPPSQLLGVNGVEQLLLDAPVAIDGAKARRDHGALCVCDHKSECSRLEVLKVRVGGSRAVCVVSGGKLASSTRRNPAGRECACSEVGHAGAKLLEQGRALVCLCSP